MWGRMQGGDEWEYMRGGGYWRNRWCKERLKIFEGGYMEEISRIIYIEKENEVIYREDIL